MTLFSKMFRPPTRRIELDLTDEQIDQLRAVMDGLPINPYVDLVVAVVKKLPLESADVPPSVADARPAQNVSEPGRGFTLIPFTPKGKAALQEIERALGELEVLDDVCLHGETDCEACAYVFASQRLPHGGDL